MNEIEFKNKILEAKLAAKQAELDESNKKLARAVSHNSQTERQQQTIKALEAKVAAGEKQISQLQNLQITDDQKYKISLCARLEAKVKELENSSAQLKIKALTEQFNTAQDGHKETLQKLFAELAVTSKLQDEVRSLRYRVSSPYLLSGQNLSLKVIIGLSLILAVSVIINLVML